MDAPFCASRRLDCKTVMQPSIRILYEVLPRSLMKSADLGLNIWSFFKNDVRTRLSKSRFEPCRHHCHTYLRTTMKFVLLSLSTNECFRVRPLSVKDGPCNASQLISQCNNYHIMMSPSRKLCQPARNRPLWVHVPDHRSSSVN